jgi:hypothetical protein
LLTGSAAQAELADGLLRVGEQVLLDDQPAVRLGSLDEAVRIVKQENG